MFVISASALESLSPEDAAAAAEGMAKINAMDDLINSGADAVSDPDGALMVTSAINSIIGGDEGASDGSVGLEVADKAVKATEVIWKLETFSTALSVYYISICLQFPIARNLYILNKNNSNTFQQMIYYLSKKNLYHNESLNLLVNKMRYM